MRDAVILDMDGTLADVRSIRHHILGKDKNYHAFHRESVNCPPNADVVTAAVTAHEAGAALLIVTAREIVHAINTMFWLTEHLPVPYTELYMRPKGDYRPDYVVKKEILALIRKDGYNVIHAYDDNPAVVQLWREERIPVTVVEGFGFE